jgi:cobyrinic acid a,c-diamide synthase
VLAGLARHRAGVRIAGVLFNQVGGAVHRQTLAAAAEALDIPVLGFVPRLPALAMPERHLGLKQAVEIADIGAFLSNAAAAIAPHVDLERLSAIAAPIAVGATLDSLGIPPLGQRIAIARDVAFAFAYPAQLETWRRQGATLSFFSPLANEAPDQAADAVFLPGGYPELHAGRLASNANYQSGLRVAAARGATVYGECGGYMVLGEALIDKTGERYAMAGLLGLVTSYAQRRMHLGYRHAALLAPVAGMAAGTALRGHEFHYSTIIDQPDAPLAHVTDADGAAVPETGSHRGCVTGTFFHMIAPAR